MDESVRPSERQFAGDDRELLIDEDTPPVGAFTLVLPIDHENQRVFLAKKACGKGKWVGFGGKLEVKEPADEAAIREMREESGISLTADQLTKVGIIMYTFFSDPNHRAIMHVYVVDEQHFDETKVHVNDEFSPNSGIWFNRANIPFDDMWSDFSLWNAMCFDKKRFRARFHYKDDRDVQVVFLRDVTDTKDELDVDEVWM